MSPNPRFADIPLGVECAWPAALLQPRTGSSLHRHRLAEAWRRLVTALQPKRRASWSR
jgi:hypothetical protein